MGEGNVFSINISNLIY